MNETIAAIEQMAVTKLEQFRGHTKRYFLLTLLGGLYIGFGIILIATIGGLLAPEGYAGLKIIQGLVFGVALSMVMMAGADLFTGNNMVMAIGAYGKKTTWRNAFQIWGFSYMGNFIGSVLCAWMFFMTGLAEGQTAAYIEKVATAKMNAPFMELLFRGILCNILVCLAVWSAFKLKNDVAKILMIFICIFPFITSGFEHSIANMTMLSLALMIPHGELVSLAGMVANLIPVSIGNIIGGAVFVGGIYFYSTVKSNEDRY